MHDMQPINYEKKEYFLEPGSKVISKQAFHATVGGETVLILLNMHKIIR
ncbi:MAG: hypothetical protein ACL7AX_04705 [Candidatus Arsenophonus phytopathogenicus]